MPGYPWNEAGGLTDCHRLGLVPVPGNASVPG